VNTRKYATTSISELTQLLSRGLTLREIASQNNLSLQGLRQACSLLDELSADNRVTNRVYFGHKANDPFSMKGKYGNA